MTWKIMKKRMVYEQPQVTPVELKTGVGLLQASKPGYIDGGDLIWPPVMS